MAIDSIGPPVGNPALNAANRVTPNEQEILFQQQGKAAEAQQKTVQKEQLPPVVGVTDSKQQENVANSVGHLGRNLDIEA